MIAARGILIFLATLLAGCVQHAAPRADCGVGIVKPRAILEARVLLLGEVHGTVEAPKFAGDLVCQLASSGKAVVLGVEHESDLQPVYDRIFAGEAEAATLIAKQISWSGKITDGRFTRAMFDLILRVRDLRASGLAVQLRAIDASSRETGLALSEGRHQTVRDERMAANADEIVRALPAGGVLVVIAGNIHTMRVKEPFGSARRFAPPMGFLLQSPNVLSLELRHLGGTASVYGAPVGGRPFGPLGNGGPIWSIELFADPNAVGVHGAYHVGKISASSHVSN